MVKSEGGGCDSSDCRDVRVGGEAGVCEMCSRGLVSWTLVQGQFATDETWLFE